MKKTLVHAENYPQDYLVQLKLSVHAESRRANMFAFCIECDIKVCWYEFVNLSQCYLNTHFTQSRILPVSVCASVVSLC